MFEPVGYAIISKDAKSGAAMNLSKFLGERVRVMEFAKDGGVLVISADAGELAMFDKEDVVRKFECSVESDFVLPPKLGLLEKMAYKTKCMSRKGGYNNLLKEMVITASLHKGEFTDGFLWQLQ
jgi:hypothetical protein